MVECVKLSEVCDILDSQRIPITESDRVKGPYPYYGANGIQDYVNDYIFDDELVLLAEDGGNFGSKEKPIAFRVSGKIWVNNHAHVLKPKATVDVDYLCYSLMFYDVSKLTNGSTRLKLTQASMREMLIPMLSLSAQQHIVKVLDTITSIIEKRKQQIALLEEAEKSLFVGMFGLPHEAHYPTKTLPQIVKNKKNALKRGPFGGSLKKDDFVESGYLVYEQRHAIHNDYNYAKYYITEKKYQEMIMFDVAPGDLLISCSGVTLGKISEVPLNAKKGIINQALLKVSLNQNIMLNSYFVALFRTDEMQNVLFGFSRGSGIPNFPSMSEVKSVKFMCPPLALQQLFICRTEKIKTKLLKMKSSLVEMEELKSALMQEYFG